MTWNKSGRGGWVGVWFVWIASVAAGGGVARVADPNTADEWASESRQHDADIVRLNNLKSIGQLLDEFHEKTGRYPLEGRSQRHKIYVYILSPDQERYAFRRWSIDGSSASAFLVMPLSEFHAELESVLGRTVEMPFDPQDEPSPWTYSYTIGNGVYHFWVCTHNSFGFATELRSGGYAVDITSRPEPKWHQWDYRALMANAEFAAAIAEPQGEPDRFKQIREAQEQECRERRLQAEVRAVLARDDFDGRLGLVWDILNPVADHWSVSKNPGTLTLTTQTGTFVRARTDYKNVFLLDNPAPIAEDFEVTTCVTSFEPKELWHQAGLILWNDQDNHLKLVYEWGEGPPALGREQKCMFTVATETKGAAGHSWYYAGQHEEKVWLRVRKRMNQFDLFTSVDGQVFTPLKPMNRWENPPGNRVSWSNGVVKRIGLFADNGSVPDANEVDASFDFLEIRAAFGN